MITFLDSQQIERSAQVGFSMVQSVNGELSVKGTIYTNNDVLKNIDRGWRFRLNDEYYRIIYVKPIDTGNQIEVEFDAVHQFFYDMAKSSMYEVLNGTHSLRYYLEAIFKNSGYKFDLDIDVKSIRKSDFGCKSRLSLFNDIIKTAGVEFLVSGHLVRIRKSIGSDQSTLVRKNFNMNEITIEKDINSFVTYQKGFGAWKDETDQTKGRYESEYESPLAKIYGRIEAEPVVDERYKETGKLLERLKQNVDNSYKISIAIDMEDLSAAGYKTSTPEVGDYIMAINETLGIRKRVRIVSLESNYDVSGKLIKRKVVCNDVGSVQRYSSEMSVLSRSVSDSKNESSKAIETATRALTSAEGKNTNYFGDKKPLDNPPGTIKKGDRLFLTAGDETELYFWSGSEWVLEPTRFDKDKFNTEFDKKAEAINKNIQQVENKAVSALAKAGSNNLLAQEAKRIGLDSIARLEEFKRQATSSQTALSGDLDVLKRTVTSEVNQASEYRRTTTEALSRMTGQMNGFATKSEVAQGIDGLTQTFAKMRVGGRNLLRGSKGPFLPDRKPANFDNNILYVGNTSIYMEQGQEYIISAKTDGNFTALHENKESDNVVLWIMDKDVRNYQIVSDLKTGTTGTKFIWNKPTGIYHLRVNTYHKEAIKSVWDVKIEKGNVATDWSPAIEDTDGLITEAKATFEQTAQGLRTDLSAIQEYVNKDGQRQDALQRYTREESARQANGVRELVNRDFVGKATYQEDVRGIERKFEAITNPQNGTIATQIANYKQSVDGRFADITSLIAGKANQTDFQRVRETSQLYERILGNTENGIADKVARMALTNQIFQVEVAKASAGGRNLFLNSLFKRDLHQRYSTYHVDDSVEQTQGQLALSIDANTKFRGTNTLKIVSTFNGKPNNQKVTFRTGGDMRLNTVDEMRNKSVRFSFWAKSTVNNTNFQARAGNRNTVEGVSLTTDWKFYDIQLTKSENSNASNEVIMHVFTAATVWIAFPKVEIGTVSTDFSEAPEDTDEAIRSVQTQLAGSWAVQNINGAGDLISGLNLGANGHNRLSGKLTHITGETLIDNASIKSAAIVSIRADQITTGTLNAASVNIINLNANKLVGLDATFLRGKIENAIIDWLVGKTLISQNGSTTLNLQTGVFTLNNEDSSITFSRSSDNTATSFSKNGIHFFENRKIIASIGQSAFSSIHDNKHKSGFSITLPNDQGISFSGYDSSSFFEINPYENSLSIQAGFSLLIGIRTSQSVSLEHVFGTQNNVNFSGFRAKGTRRQELRFYADGRIEITRG